MTITRSSSLVVGGILALSSMFGSTAADSNCPTINSIAYCSPAADTLGYANVGYSGSYQQVTGMDKDSCTCTYSTKQFSGPGAPLSEPLSLHFRGPLSLKQFAFYSADNKKSKRSEEHLRRHAHGHKHRRVAEADYDYDIVTEHTTVWSTVEVEGTGSPHPSDVKNKGKNKNHDSSPAASSPTSAAPKPSSSSKPNPPDLSSAGTFKRQAYYNSKQGVSEGLVFLNHRGGQGSGDFDMACLGQSISYASKDATTGSAGPVTLGDVTIASDDEFIIYSDQKCQGNDCGYFRPGIPAYHGFDGDIRVFAFEFIMPEDKGDSGGKGAYNIPAIWALNAQIARVAQYGIKSGPCSCWPKCGEFDIFEALPGNPAAGQSAVNMMKSHIHCAQGGEYGGGGNQGYFDRPLDNTIKVAAILLGENIYITKLPDNTNFDETLSDDVIANAKKTKSLFQLPN